MLVVIQKHILSFKQKLEKGGLLERFLIIVNKKLHKHITNCNVVTHTVFP